MQTLGKINNLNRFVFGICLIGVAVYFIAIPKFGDDLRFISYFKSILSAQGSDPESGIRLFAPGGITDRSFGQAVGEFYRDMFYNDNIRIGNMLALWFLLLPKWVGGLVSTFAYALMITGMLRIAGADWRTSSLLPVALLLVVIFFPWQDNMILIVYQFNYVIGSGLILTVLSKLFIANDKCATLGKAGYLIWPLLGLLTGSWHEGLSAPVIAGVAAMMTSDKRYRNLRTVLLMSGMIVGFALIEFWCVGAQRRFAATISGGESIQSRLLLIPFRHISLISLMTVGAIAALILKRRRREILTSPVMIFVWVSVTVSAVVQIAFGDNRRVGWWIDIASTVGILFILQHWKHGLFDRYRRDNAWHAITSTIFSVSWALLIAYHSLMVGHECRRVTALFEKDPEATIFIRQTDSNLLRLISPGTQYVLNTYGGNGIPYYYAPAGWSGRLFAIPSALRYIEEGEGVTVNDRYGIRSYQKVLYMPANEEFKDYIEFYADIEFRLPQIGDRGDGGIQDGDPGLLKKKNKQVECYAFRSEADGKEYIYLYPYVSTVFTDLFDVKTITPHTDDESAQN